MFDRTRAYVAALAARAVRDGLSGDVVPSYESRELRAQLPPKARRRSNPAGYFPHKSGQGSQECARRVRQIQRFQLTSSSGLVSLAREEWHQRFGVDS